MLSSENTNNNTDSQNWRRCISMNLFNIKSVPNNKMQTDGIGDIQSDQVSQCGEGLQ